MHFQAAPDRWRPPRNPFRIGLGEMFRALKIDTEVGSSDPAASAKIQGICASARAYAFLGGVERSLDENAKLGFHRFYIKIPWRNLVLNCSPGQDLVDEAQRTTAALLLYVMKIGVDARLVTLEIEVGPGAMLEFIINAQAARHSA